MRAGLAQARDLEYLLTHALYYCRSGETYRGHAPVSEPLGGDARARGLKGAASYKPCGTQTQTRREAAANAGAFAKESPEAAGFPNGLWTVPRVAQLVEERFGVAYGNTRVWQMLRQLGFTPQRPTGKARQRDEAAIETWKRKRWPQVKKTLPGKCLPRMSNAYGLLRR